MSPTSRPDGGRRGLQIVLATLACIPFASGLAGMLTGPRALPGTNEPVTADLESEYRYTHAMWFAAGPIIWSTVPHVERQTPVLRVVSATVFLGGLARLLAWRASGRPHPLLVGATGLELFGIPVLLAWQRRVVRLAGDT